MKNKIKELFFILLGNFLLAVSVAYFVLPYDILSGGLAGIAVITNGLLNWNETLVIEVLTIVFFIMGWIFLGKEFALKTAVSSVAYPVFLEILTRIPYEIETNMLLACLYGGLIAGIGLGIVFINDASTGGTDIPSMILANKTGISLSTTVFIFDALIAIAGFFTYGIEQLMYGIIYIYISSWAINRVMVPKSNEAIALYIITNETEKIKNYIHINLYRGTTILQAKGGYTNEDREVIMTVVKRNQYNSLNKYIEEVDPYAFVIVSDAKEIKGEGFTYEYRV